jgi:hypothetical protein
MRIVHFSDWHGQTTQLPEADLYICSGDFYPDFPTRVQEEVSQPYQVPRFNWGIEPLSSSRSQGLWAGSNFQNFFGSPDAPIVCVRGNHDFAPLSEYFTQFPGFIFEFIDNETIEVNGLTITGHRGIPYIFGTWNDEVQRPDLKDRMRHMPQADVYLTHYGPHGIIQNEGKNDYGLEGMGDWMINLAGGRKGLHCFGHIHGAGGQTVTYDNLTFSNAATTFNVIDF